MPGPGGHVLVVCEKPDAARRVADALSDGKAASLLVDGVTAFRFNSRGREYVVCSAQGHLYSVSDPLDERTVYPVFDLEWYPSDAVDEGSPGASRRISAIRKLAAGASSFVNACDFDAEGETIGFNVLKYACGGKEADASRAKFSTLTQEELLQAFADASPQAGQGLARSGRVRHYADFAWGVNLSRMLSRAAFGAGGRFFTVSAGRVQGPTLNFLVEREREIREFVPIPFWRVDGVFEKEGKTLRAGYSEGTVETRAGAEKVREECLGKQASVSSVKRSVFSVAPPAAFSIGDLQKEAYRAFGLTPSRTMQAAERLYLGALISYPRTGSQKLPPAIGYLRILKGLEGTPHYSQDAAEVLGGSLRPAQGGKDDPAHPAIHPTGERPMRQLAAPEASVYDLVVRRFLAAFGAPAKRETVNATISVGAYKFALGGGRTLVPGWMKLYGKYAAAKDSDLPRLAEGERLHVRAIEVAEERSKRSPRYNQSTLLEQMEKESIGTKATRADVISTLVSRGYVSGGLMEVTDLGLSVADALRRFSPSILSTKLTREMEEELEKIESGSADEKVLVRRTVRAITERLAELEKSRDSVGLEISSARREAASNAQVLGPCPVCKTGKLLIVRSKTTRKRFVGCSNYGSGCRASAPLPQRGSIRAAARPCRHCSWPVVYVSGGRRPWRLCVNMSCPGKKK